MPETESFRSKNILSSLLVSGEIQEVINTSLEEFKFEFSSGMNDMTSVIASLSKKVNSLSSFVHKKALSGDNSNSIAEKIKIDSQEEMPDIDGKLKTIEEQLYLFLSLSTQFYFFKQIFIVFITIRK